MSEKVSSGESSLGTTHLRNHYKNKHGREGQMLLNFSQEEESQILESFKYDEKLSERKLVKAIIMHEYPFSIVEHAYFTDFIRSLQPSFPSMSRDIIRKNILELFVEQNPKVYNKFGSLACRLSATMDLWTSRQNEGYLCVAVHYIDDDWRIQKKIINFMHLEGRYTELNLCQAFMENMIEWNIDRKLFSLTLDNDCANDVCIRDVVTRLNDQKALVSSGIFFHVRCATHIINLVVQDGLNKIKDVVENIRQIIILIKNSPLQYEEFQKRAIECNLDTKKTLSVDVSTRWNSTYLMLRDAIYYKNAFKRLQCVDPYKYAACPTNEQWEKARTLCKCLKSFYRITELLSGIAYPTANLFFVEFCDIQLQIKEWSKSFDELSFSMATSVKEKFDNYWQQCNLILAVASFLDPRYKMEIMNFYFPQMYSNGGIKEIAEVREAIKKLYNEYSSTFSRSVDHEVNESIDAASQSNVYNLDDFEDNRKRKLSEYLFQLAQQRPAKTDLDQYIDEGPFRWIEGEKQFDILSWWKTNGAKYPILSRIARDILAIPVATVASESAFSIGGRVIDAYRSRLNPEAVEALVCTQDWIRSEDNVVDEDVNYSRCECQ